MHLTEWRSLRGAAIEQVGVRPAISSLPASLPPITLLPHPSPGSLSPPIFAPFPAGRCPGSHLRSNLAFDIRPTTRNVSASPKRPSPPPSLLSPASHRVQRSQNANANANASPHCPQLAGIARAALASDSAHISIGLLGDPSTALPRTHVQKAQPAVCAALQLGPPRSNQPRRALARLLTITGSISPSSSGPSGSSAPARVDGPRPCMPQPLPSHGISCAPRRRKRVPLPSRRSLPPGVPHLIALGPLRPLRLFSCTPVLPAR
ncbi:hypothetical protein HETIRDRAFT_451929 [Heterobasidion irregulare TC 32-1]|uniref:Uncharacterized protein n=1 Tax=Heterobasidion irregulare (strain TC 32-1) TaxID=747525 RepID=W4K3C2_HETIT|nr:uncharacterized protein HETIRDRAFT_451929 [Heterobasidion irregulare TC 32-1]ETW80297.1 hypothetical protein HETIRDRAFT_451929 [Heterobasidion irregulare TC 32-1]